MLESGFEITKECFESMLVKLTNSYLKMTSKWTTNAWINAC